MKSRMKWLLVPAGLALVVMFAAVGSAEAQVVTYGYGGYGYHGGCHAPPPVYYPVPVARPVVRYYRAPVVVPRPVYRYSPYRAYYAPPRWSYYGVW